MTDCHVLALVPFAVKAAHSLEMLRSVAGRGIDVHVATFGEASATYTADDMEDFGAAGRLVDLSRASQAETFEIVRTLIESQSVDLVVQAGATRAYADLPRWKEANPNVQIADLLYNEYAHTLNHFLYEAAIDAAIVESEAMRRYVERASAKDNPVVELVPSGVDLEWFGLPEGRARSGSALTIGFIGRMSPEKNPIGFIDMAERLLHLDPELEFRIAGEGVSMTEVEERLAGSPFRGRIHLLGFVNDARSVLHDLDVLVLPSKFDGRPGIVMQANACGVPVLAAPVGAIPELIHDGVNGYLVFPEEAERVSDLVSTWKRSPESLTRLKRLARAYACEHFGRAQMIDGYVGAFRRLAAMRLATSQPSAG